MKQSYMNKKWANLYVKLTAKNPILFLTLILLCTLLVLRITMTTKVDVIQTYDAKIQQDTLIVTDVYSEEIDSIYVYENRNDAVYKVQIMEGMINNEEYLLVIPIDELGFEPQSDNLRVDIPVRKISLFKRVFLQGGKNE